MMGDSRPELRRALAFLGSDRDAATVVDRARRLGLGGGLVAGAVMLGVGLLVGGTGLRWILWVALMGSIAVGCCTGFVVYRAPVWQAAVRRTRALGAAPGLVGRMVLRLRLAPATERAVQFASRTGNSALARSLGGHARRSRGTPAAGLRSFAAEWAPWFPAIDRSATLLRSAANAPAERRDRCLDRALSAVIAGTEDDMAAFVGDVRAPLSGIYAFGVLLPLSLVALLPAAAAAGFPVGPLTMTFLYILILPGSLIVASGWLLLQRPVAFPPPRIDASHPDVTDRWWLAIGVGVLSAVSAWLLTRVVVADWAGPVAGVGVGVGLATLVVATPRKAVLDHVRAVESGLPDALTVIGGDVAEGIAVEQAVITVGETVSGATGEVFERAGHRSRTLRVAIEEAFLGEGGPLTTVPSPRAHGVAVLLGVAAREGRPAGEVLLELAQLLEDLRELERESTRQLATVTQTLSNTAAFFGPLVGGATVALAAGIGADAGGLSGGLSFGATTGTVPQGAQGSPDPAAGWRGTGPIALGALGHVIGAYVLLLSAILTALATSLERGLDRTLVAYRIGLALPTATVTYLASFVAVGLLL